MNFFFSYSKLAVFDGKKAIRGGIPFVFPQFGPWSFGPNHGFARIVRWTLERGPERLPNGDVEAVLSLTDTDFTRSMWNYPWVLIFRLSPWPLSNDFVHSFRITYRIILREKELHFHIGVYNPSKELAFSFNLLLHTYLKVPDVRKCQITGLHGCTFIDKVSHTTRFVSCANISTADDVCRRETAQFIRRAARSWRSTSGPIGYTSTRTKSTSSRTLSRDGRCDCKNIISPTQVSQIPRLHSPLLPKFILRRLLLVIWNPWLDKARETPDFGDDEYPNMVCVEAGHVSSPVLLLPGTAYEASQILQVIVNPKRWNSRKSQRQNQNQPPVQAQQQQQQQQQAPMPPTQHLSFNPYIR